tara:strand:+ start:70 stop:372 length:303 start_codon:yes stop_codon:yes gene_type:complete
MNRTTAFLALLFLTAPAFSAEKPVAVPSGATPIENPTAASKVFRENSDLGQRFSERDNTTSQVRQFSADEAHSRTGQARSMKTLDAPTIKPRAVIAAPQS